MSLNPEKKRVVIVGAGASGIAAATRLYENGIKDIIVLEAEGRIGGRIHTINIEDGILEMGAQWIHGEKNNVVYELASAKNLTVHSTSMFNNMIYARSSGEIIEKKLTTKLENIKWKWFQEFPNMKTESFKNCGEFYINILETELKKNENSDIPVDIQSEFIELCHQSMNSYDASETWFNTSITTVKEFEECEGNLTIMWNGVGYRTLFDILMEKSQNLSNKKFISDIIITNTEVKHISLQDDNQTIKIECSNGKTFLANHVIVTVSVGVLQEIHSELFKNFPLPELKIRSINNIELGTVDKIYLLFSKPWWPLDSDGFHLLWTEADRKECEELKIEWAVGIFSITTVEFAPNVLCGWLSGAAARTMETLDEQFVHQTVMQLLRKFLSKKWEIQDADRIIRSTWKSNKHFRGSYSNRTLKTEAENVSASTLAIPVENNTGIPILLFAGEATSAHHYSTVHGAVESGWREADRLIPFIKNL